jgi:tyrosine-protein phosphatase
LLLSSTLARIAQQHPASLHTPLPKNTLRVYSPPHLSFSFVMVEDVLLLSSPASSLRSVRKDISLAMASVTKTDPPSLKRTYTLVASNPPSPQDRIPPFKVPALSPPADNRMSLSLKRRYPFCKSQGSPTASSDLSTSEVPAFVSIFDTEMSGCSPVRETSQFSGFPGQSDMTSEPSIHHQTHKSHSSISTSASSSNSCSPTTTISTIESASLEDRITPDSSPDTAEGLMALPSFRPESREANDLSIVPPSPDSHCSRPQTPSKKPRNQKNLSLNVPPSPGMTQPRSPHDTEMSKATSKSVSAPSSPAFIMPPAPQNPRRRPSHLGLTIKLPGTLEKPTGLRHHQSSPSLFTPAQRGGSIGGLVVPPTASHRQTTFQFNQRPTFNNRWATSEASPESSSASTNSPPKSPEILHEMDEEEDIEPPRSGEAKSPAYPTGPALIFEPNIYLYSEPNAELASQFDVVINVAREVLNPFKAAPAPDVVPDTACTISSFKTAFEEAIFSPIKTGTETPKQGFREPEYVHMPWDHNTPILNDLPGLVELISERSGQGKKVLVHCQCGVSRSATLLIAYSMFKNPEKSMQDAYSAVKSKSRWIGPNMSLIYQLTDWKKMICSDAPKAGFGGWRNGPATAGLRNKPPGSGNLGRGRGMGDCDDGPEAFPEPQTAPLPGRRTSPSVSPMMSPVEPRSEGHPIRPQFIRTRSEHGGFMSSSTPGPSSAPPAGSTTSPLNRQSWPDGDAKLFCTPTLEPSPLSRGDEWPVSRSYEPPMPTRMPPPPPPPPQQPASQRNSGVYSLEKSTFRIPGQFETDISEPPTPSIVSPRNSGTAGAAGTGGFWATVPNRRSGWGFFSADPRSPTERGTSAPVIRNIFDVL